VLERRLAFDQEEERGRVVEVFVARHSSGASQTRPESKNAIAPPPGRSDFLAAVIHSTDSRYERKMDRERHLSIYIYIYCLLESTLLNKSLLVLLPLLFCCLCIHIAHDKSFLRCTAVRN